MIMNMNYAVLKRLTLWLFDSTNRTNKIKEYLFKAPLRLTRKMKELFRDYYAPFARYCTLLSSNNFPQKSFCHLANSILSSWHSDILIEISYPINWTNDGGSACVAIWSAFYTARRLTNGTRLHQRLPVNRL